MSQLVGGNSHEVKHTYVIQQITFATQHIYVVSDQIILFFFFFFNRKLKNPHQEVNYLTTAVAVETTFGTSHQLGVAYVSQLIEAEGAALIPCLGVISQGSSGNELTHLERLFPATVILNNYMKEKLEGPDPGFHQQPFVSLEI